MKFKDFEIRPTFFLNRHKYPRRWDIVKWEKHDKPMEVTEWETGEKKMKDTFCFSVATVEWKEHYWEFRSYGTRFFEYYEEGLCEFILEWLELTDLTRKFTEDA